MQQDNYRLIVRRGPQPNQAYDLNKDVITLGRDITNDIVLNDPEVSRHHIRLTRGGGGFTMEDLGSTNGTYVNGQRLVGAKPLNNGDMIGLGETVTLGYELVRMVAGDDAGQPAGAPPTAPSPAAPYAPPAAGQPAPYAPQQPSPYAPPAAGQPAPYAPQQPAPYAPPAAGAGQPPYGQPSPYAAPGTQPPPQQRPPAAPYGAPPAGAGQPPQGYGQSPYAPPPAYAPTGTPDYEAAQEDEGGRSPMRLILIGCIAVMLFCCCGTIAGLWVIDSANLWCTLPGFREIITPLIGAVGQAIGLVPPGPICPG